MLWRTLAESFGMGERFRQIGLQWLRVKKSFYDDMKYDLWCFSPEKYSDVNHDLWGWKGRSFPCNVPVSAVVKSCRYSSLPVHDVVVNKRRVEGAPKRDSWCHLYSYTHYLMHNLHFSNDGTGVTGSSVTDNQYDFGYCWKGCILTLPLRMNYSDEAMWPKTCCYILDGGEK